MSRPLEYIQGMLQGKAPPPLIAQLIGFKATCVAPGQAEIEFQSGKQHANPMGTLHGGVLCDIADAAMGMTNASLLQEGETFTTLELKINLLKPVWQAKLRAISQVVRQGEIISLVEYDILDEQDTLVARASSTCMTLRGAGAEGRRVLPRS